MNKKGRSVEDIMLSTVMSKQDPRVGGWIDPVTKTDAWTGGPNKRANRYQKAKGTNAWRVSNLKTFMQIEERNQKGFSEIDQFKTPEETMKDVNGVTLTAWLEKLNKKLVSDGVDTVFNVYDPVLDTEINMLERWGQITGPNLTKWIKDLTVDGIRRTLQELLDDQATAIAMAAAATAAAQAVAPQGVVVPAVAPIPVTLNYPICDYDLHNLDNSAIAIQASVSASMWRQVHRSVRINASGPEILYAILQKHQLSSAASVRLLLQKLQELNIRKEPQENVDKFADKVLEFARRIEGTGNCPSDLNVVVAKYFLR